MKTRIFALINLLALIFGLSFIQNNVNKNFGSTNSYWSKDDLKLIDPIDSISINQCDILAVFMRKNIYELEIRVDFLNENDLENCTLEANFFIPLQHEIIYKISTDLKNQTKPELHSVIFNKEYQYILLRFPNTYAKYNVAFKSMKKNTAFICDLTQQINLLQPSPKPFQISLMAYNTHPGFMPSQILRSWDGAHTGPNGQRHGLKFLLEAVQASQLPVTLLDLNTPSGLAAIDLLGQTERLKLLQSSSLIFLPLSININQQYSQIFINSFMKASYSYSYTNQNMSFYKLNKKLLINYDDEEKVTDLTTEYGNNGINGPKGNSDPFSSNGLSEATVKRIFNNNKNSTNVTNIVFALNESIIADQKYANKILLSIKNHPWIEVVDPLQPLSFSKSPNFKVSPDNAQRISTLPDEIISQTVNSAGPFQDFLLNYVNDINGRSESSQFRELSNQYLPNIYYYVAANDWAENFSENSSCDIDIDHDGMNECILSNQNFFGIIELDLGRLAFLVVHSKDSVYQMIAATSSVMFGLGPEQEWNIDNYQFADPQEIPGAFFSKKMNMVNYTVLNVEENSVNLTGNNETKRFIIEDDSFKFEFDGKENMTFLLPIIFAPNCLPTIQKPGDYKISFSEADLKISVNCLSETASIKFSDPGSFNVSSFIESQRYMLLPENPELSYTDGHYYKIGLTLIKLNYKEPEILTVSISQ